MYPFATDKKEFFTQKSEEEVKVYLEQKIYKKKFLQIRSDSKFYGKVNSNFAVFELGQFPTRNAWRPVIKLEWAKYDDRTRVISKYSLDKSMCLLYSILPFFGIYISIEQNMIIPFVTLTIIYLIIIFGMFQMAYRYSKKSTTNFLNELLTKL